MTDAQNERPSLDRSYTAESHDGNVAACLALEEGHPTFAVESDGRAVIRPSPIGLHTLDGSYAADLTVVWADRGSVETTYETPAGKRREHSYRATVLTMRFQTERGDVFDVDLRVSNDGAAYRYRLPGRGSVVVTSEESAFRPPSDAMAWLMPFEKKHEGVWHGTTVDDSEGRYGYPALFEVDDRWALVTEADVDGRYVASQLAVDGAAFHVRFPDSENHRMETAPEEVSAESPLATPWRVVVTGDLGTVVESDLVTDLIDSSGRDGDPCQLQNADWIRPGRVAWSWWYDGSSPGDHDVQRDYVDYAAERGWEYVLVDAGWDAEWIPDLVAYADNRSVDVLLWSRWSDLDTSAKRDARLDQWVDWGIAGVKVDYMNSDTQAMMRFYDALAEATAERELLLNVHGSITPKGLRRRWPHLITYEGIHGAENYHPVPNTIPPEHNVILPYTRNVLGPMDYTPVTFSAETRQTTVGHELALSVVFETGLQHFADGIESYAKRPLAEQFLEVVPAAWDETCFVGGRPGEVATIARRRDDRWFLGSILAGAGRTVTVPFEFLDDRTYAATLYRDDEVGETLISKEFRATAATVKSVKIPENGGFAIVCRPSEQP